MLWGHPNSRRIFGTVSSSPGTHGLRCCVCRRTSGCSRCSGRPAPSQVSALFIMLTLWSVHECIGRVLAVAWTSWEQWLHSELPLGVCTDGQYLYHYLLWADVSKYVLIFSVSSTFGPLSLAWCKLLKGQAHWRGSHWNDSLVFCRIPSWTLGAAGKTLERHFTTGPQSFTTPTDFDKSSHLLKVI